jgi:two-component system LytT family sensor kinase
MKKNALYLLHAVIIALFVIFTLLNARSMSAYYGGQAGLHFLDSFLFNGYLLGITYAAYFAFIPRLISRGKYIQFGIALPVMVVGFTAGFYFIALLVTHLLPGVQFHLFVPGEPGGIAGMVICMGMAGTFFRLFIEWLNDSYTKAELDKQGFKSELALLKSQLNPHFLFNTLNNIDSLINEKSPRASLALNKLSGIMRYVVYDSEKDMVPLQDEITYIQDYISLQKLRMEDERVVGLTIEGKVKDQEIAPMLFIPFIENAFKHSSLKNTNGNRIRIAIETDENRVVFRCKNPIADRQKDKGSGVGLSIIKRRLDLVYKNNYTLVINDSSGNFSVNLEIRIS